MFAFLCLIEPVTQKNLAVAVRVSGIPVRAAEFEKPVQETHSLVFISECTVNWGLNHFLELPNFVHSKMAHRPIPSHRIPKR